MNYHAIHKSCKNFTRCDFFLIFSTKCRNDLDFIPVLKQPPKPTPIPLKLLQNIPMECFAHMLAYTDQNTMQSLDESITTCDISIKEIIRDSAVKAFRSITNQSKGTPPITLSLLDEMTSGYSGHGIMEIQNNVPFVTDHSNW